MSLEVMPNEDITTSAKLRRLADTKAEFGSEDASLLYRAAEELDMANIRLSRLADDGK